MKDLREDQLLCPDCYVPVQLIQMSRNILTAWYTCGNCNHNYDQSELVRASELERRIEEAFK